MSDAAMPAPASPWPAVASAMRANLLPGMGLWAVAVAVIATYHFVPAAGPAFAAIAEAKTTWGFLFSCMVNATTGGLVPWLIARAMGQRLPWSHLLFLVCLSGYRGMEVDAFYRLQSHWFGDGNDLMTITVKTTVDMCSYSAFWTAPTTIILMAWKDGGFTRRAFLDAARPSHLAAVWPQLVIANWVVWIPTVMVIYAMPAPLQIPLLCLASSFWILVALMVAKRG